MSSRVQFLEKILNEEGIEFDFRKSPPFPEYGGSYILIVRIDKDRLIKIVKLGRFIFKEGEYFYVGSAKSGISRRVSRYFNEKRKTRWYIVYLINKGKVLGVITIKSASEEEISNILRKFMNEPVKGFGSSDKNCFSLLFF